MNQIIVPKISFITYNLGCRTNRAELEDISLQLTDYGLRQINTCSTNIQYPIPNTIPNLVLINTCVVTGKAERETRKAIRHFRKLYPKAKVIVLGCAVTAKDKFQIVLPEADLLISNKEKNKAAEIIVDSLSSTNCCNLTHDRGLYCNKCEQGRYSFGSSYTESERKFIKIQDGCSSCCSFCITTHLRGEPKSKKPEGLIDLISEFVNSGIKESILTGINIGLYGNDLRPQINIWSLADRIIKETKIERLTFSTVYPEMVLLTGSDPVIRNERVSRCFHLALQSGSQSVLRRMNRPTDLKKLLSVINQIREIQPDFTFRADVITGFPDETEGEHQETLDFLKGAQISFAHVFPYSPRIGTVAYEMVRRGKWQDIPMEVKRRRAEEIGLLVGKSNRELGRGMIGKTYRTLIIRELSGKLEGISDNGRTVIVQSSIFKVQSQMQGLELKTLHKGEFVEVKITGCEKGQLLGEILSLPI